MRRVAVAAVLAACTKFQTIEPGTCGNGLLEDGEDCDSTDARCVACSLTCSSDADCLDMPAPRDGAAYRCGFDQPQRLCHAPGGTIAGLAGAQAFDVLGFGTSDINGDGIGDAVGLSGTEVIVRYGDPTGQLAAVNQAVMPHLQGPPAVLDVNGDGAVDIVLPTRDGLVAFTGAHSAMVPYTFTISFGGMGGPQALDALPLGPNHVAVFFGTNTALQLGIEGIGIGGPQMMGFQICDGQLDPGKFDAANVAGYDVSAIYGKTAIMFALQGLRFDGSTELCAMTVAETAAGSGTFTPTAVTPAGATAAGTAPVLANLDAASGCPSLVLADGTRYAAIKLTSACQLAGTAVTIAGPPGLGPAIGRVPLVPPIANHAADALVLQGGIASYNTVTNQLETLYVSDPPDQFHPFTMSGFADFDGDNKLDVVIAARDAAGLDVLYRLTAPDGFLRLRIGTDSPVEQLMTGDYDGNSVGDVLAVERAATQTKTLDRLVIAYGTRDQILPPIEVGEFTRVLALCPVQLFDSTDQTGVIDDVALIDHRDSNVLALLHGTPQRELLPYLDLRGVGAWQTSAFAGVVGGHFGDGDPAGSIDLIAFEVSLTGQGTIWKLLGAGPGAVAAPPAGMLQVPNSSTAQPIGAGVCAAPGDAELCVNGMAVVRWPTDGLDSVIALDPINGTAAVIAPDAIVGGTSPLLPVFTQVMPLGSRQVPTWVIADSDGDGVPELIFTFIDARGRPGVRSCTVTGTTIDCGRDLFANAPDLEATCPAVAYGPVTPQGQTASSGPASSLVLGCGAAIYRLDYDATGYHPVDILDLTFPTAGFALADVTGDLVPDLLVRNIDPIAPTLFVYPQCTSRGCP